MRGISGFILGVVFAASVGLGFSMGQTVRFKEPPPAAAVAPDFVPVIDAPATNPQAADTAVLIPRADPSLPSAAPPERSTSLPDVMTRPLGSAGSPPIETHSAESSTQAPAPVFAEDQQPSTSLPLAEAGIATAAVAGSYPAVPSGGSEPAATAQTTPQGAARVRYATGPHPAKNPAIGPSVMRYHVQAGTFSTWQDAEALSLRLKVLGYAVKVTADGSLYRVWVGGYLDQPTAQRLVQNLQKVGFEATLAQ
jgi:cell division protein FtsN